MQQDLDGRVFGSPSLYGNNVYVGTERGTIYCMDAQTLTIIWEIRLQREGAIVASPAIDSAGYVYVAVSYEDDWRVSNSTTANPEYGTYSIFKLSPGGAKIWRFLSSYVLHSTPVVDETNEIVYFGGHDKRVIGLDMYTGKPRACRDASAKLDAGRSALQEAVRLATEARAPDVAPAAVFTTLTLRSVAYAHEVIVGNVQLLPRGGFSAAARYCFRSSGSSCARASISRNVSTPRTAISPRRSAQARRRRT